MTKAHAQVTEALEQQTATSEILRVIGSSPTDVQPVFEALAKSTVRLCDGARSTVWRPERDDLLRCVAQSWPLFAELDAGHRVVGEDVFGNDRPALGLRVGSGVFHLPRRRPRLGSACCQSNRGHRFRCS